MPVTRPYIGVPSFKNVRTRDLATLLTWGFGLAALALVVYWANRLSAPGPVAALPATPETVVLDGTGMARLFGVETGGVETSLDGIALTGVFAPLGGAGGFATFRTAQGATGVAVGQEVRPGLTLERVEAGRAILSAGGSPRVLELPRPKLDNAGPAQAPATLMRQDN